LDSTGYTAVELLFDEPRPDIFKKFNVHPTDEAQTSETHPQKIAKAFMRMKQRAMKRNAKRKWATTNWEPQVGDLVLIKRHVTSDETIGIIGKFLHPFSGPVRITEVLPPATYQVYELDGKPRGKFSKDSLKPYVSAT
jgi:hypothetical protein